MICRNVKSMVLLIMIAFISFYGYVSISNFPVYAHEVDDVICTTDLQHIAKDDIPELLNQLYYMPELFGLYKSDLFDAYIGDGLTIIRRVDNVYEPAYDMLFYPLINSNGVFALLTAIKCEGHISCTLGVDFAPDLNRYVKNLNESKNFTLFSVPNGMFALEDDGNIATIYNRDINGILDIDLSDILPEMKKAFTNWEKISQSNRPLSYYINYDIDNQTDIGIKSVVIYPPATLLYPYPIIAQGSLPICWAGSIASIVNYEIGSSYTATGVCDALNHSYTPGYFWSIDNYLDTLLPSPYIPTCSSYSLYDSEIRTVIGNNDPAYMHLSCRQVIGLNHAVALYGYHEDSLGNVSKLLIMDPATGSYKSCTRDRTSAWVFSLDAYTYFWQMTCRLLYE